MHFLPLIRHALMTRVANRAVVIFDSDKPPLKKVSKMANQLEKIKMFAARASQANYRASLKQVAKKEYTLDDEKETKSKLEKPEWAERSNKNIPRLSKSESQPVSGAATDVEEEEEDDEE